MSERNRRFESTMATAAQKISSTVELPVMNIEPTSGWRAIDFAELWAYRELLYTLVWRDVKVRYKQTFLGAIWVMGQPLVTMAIFTFLFHRIANFQSGSTPYPLFVIAALL